MNLTNSKPPAQGAASTGIVPATGIAPGSTSPDFNAATPIPGPGIPIISVVPIGPPLADAPGGQS